MATDATGTPTTLGIPKYNVAVDVPSGLGFNATMDAVDALLTTITGATSGSKLVLPANIKDYPTDGTKALFGDGTWKAPTSSENEITVKTLGSDVGSITGTTEGTATSILVTDSVTYTGARVRVTFWAPGATLTGTDGNAIKLILLRDATVLGQFGAAGNGTDGAFKAAVTGIYYDTPSAAAHTYTVKALVANGTGVIKAGAGGSGNLLPAFIQVSRV